MVSTAEAKVISMYMNAKEAVAIQDCLNNLGHSQNPTTMNTGNSTGKGIVTGKMKQKIGKAFNIQKDWLINRCKLSQFDIKQGQKKNNTGDYFTNTIQATITVMLDLFTCKQKHHQVL